MASSLDPHAPVIVGAGQIVQRPGDGDLDPIGLAVEAVRRAGDDSGAGERLLRRAGSMRHVATTCWSYRDEAELIAATLGIVPRETVRTTLFGGDGPQRLVGDTARSIANGDVEVAVVSGAEAVASMLAFRRAGETPPWGEQAAEVAPTRTVGTDRAPTSDSEMAVGLMAPIYNYALLETAVRASSGADPRTHMRRLGELWSRFSEVAANNPYAWLAQAREAAELIEPAPANRPVAAPYLKLLTANIQVDQASALILCSAQAAAAAGVPRDRWVFICSTAYAHEEWFMSERADLAAAPAIRAAGQAALRHADVGIDDIEHVDLYSCFPSAVQIAARELGLSIDDPARPVTVTGGLTFAGGPGNNYSGHSIATLIQRLRDADGYALATAVGWYLTKNAVGVYSARPPARSFRDIDAEQSIERPPPRRASSDYSGPATLEAYTVPYARDGEPEAAIVSAITPEGMRALTRSTDEEQIQTLLETDPLGHRITL